jgi:hypothetical protein
LVDSVTKNLTILQKKYRPYKHGPKLAPSPGCQPQVFSWLSGLQPCTGIRLQGMPEFIEKNYNNLAF